MSNTTTETQIDVEVYIPSDDEVQSTESGRAWRFANGKIVRGPELEKGSGRYQEEREKVVGILERVGIHQGEGENGDWYCQLEADIKTRDGVVHLKSALSGEDNDGNPVMKPSVATLNFAWGLCQFAKGELLCITTERGAPITRQNGKPGGCPTYVNFGRVEVKDGKTQSRRLYREKRALNAPKLTAAQQWTQEHEPKIKAHSAYAEREKAPTHLSELTRECTERGWPTPEQAPGEWLAMIAAAFGQQVRATLSDLSEDEWGEVRVALDTAVKAGQIGDCPAPLVPVKQRLAAAAAGFGGGTPAKAGFGAPTKPGFGAVATDPFEKE